eukprot:gene10338-7231_t
MGGESDRKSKAYCQRGSGNRPYEHAAESWGIAASWRGAHTSTSYETVCMSVGEVLFPVCIVVYLYIVSLRREGMRDTTFLFLRLCFGMSSVRQSTQRRTRSEERPNQTSVFALPAVCKREEKILCPSFVSERKSLIVIVVVFCCFFVGSVRVVFVVFVFVCFPVHSPTPFSLSLSHSRTLQRTRASSPSAFPSSITFF